MDQLERLIAEKKEALDHLRKEMASLAAVREKLEVELRAYEEAARLRPAFDSPQPSKARRLLDTVKSFDDGADVRTRGKQPGAISHKWREFLGEWVRRGNRPCAYDDLYGLAQNLEIDGQIHSIRDRIRKFKTLGFVEEIEGKFVVSQEAIARFGLPQREEPPSQEAESGSTSEREGAATPELSWDQPTVPAQGER